MNSAVIQRGAAVGARPARRAGTPDVARLKAWRSQVWAALWSQAAGWLVMFGAVLLGYADALAVALWAPFACLFSAFVLVALQRGWTWHLPDPTLTAAQIAYSVTSTALCYAMLGPLRMLALPMALLGLVFSIFALPARAVGLLTAYTLALYATVMGVMSQWQPERYRLAEEAVILVQFVVALLPVALLATRMSELRARLGRQKADLESALERIQDMALRDELTGLANRRHLVERLEAAQARAAEGTGCCVAVLDLDHFKRINDTHGHAAGDAVLREFAALAHSALLGSDRIGRWGGEEFLVIFDTGDLEGAATAARRIVERAQAHEVLLAGGAVVRFTVSIGLVQMRSGEAHGQTVERADAALYAAKQAGRNRLVMGS